MEGFNPANGGDVRKAALLLQERFPDGGRSFPKQKGSGRSTRSPVVPHNVPNLMDAETSSKPGKRVFINHPLDFALKDLDLKHPYLRERGFSRETVEHFGLGYCNRGMLKGRIAIPIHDPSGALVAYAGRITDDRLVSETCPKYLFPPPRERNEEVHEFDKSLVLYNAHMIAEPLDHLCVVEGFPGTWWLWQAGITNVVALMARAARRCRAGSSSSASSRMGRSG